MAKYLFRTVSCAFFLLLTVASWAADGEKTPENPLFVATLQDQNGKPVDPNALRGKILVLNFIFTQCASACPLQSRELAGVQKSLPETLRERIHLLSVSIDPAHDSPRALRNFARDAGADLRYWTFATGKSGDIDRIAKRFPIFDPRKPRASFDDHATAIYLIDSSGAVRQRYAGRPLDTAQLTYDIVQLAELEFSILDEDSNHRGVPLPNAPDRGLAGVVLH